MAAAEFAELLRELKDRSGLSYGTLAKRLHMSTSTLHRYCNGDAVPTDYAPVERLARLCKASPAELVELHRRWVLADAARGKKESGPAAEPDAASRVKPDAVPVVEPDAAPAEGVRGGDPEPGPAALVTDLVRDGVPRPSTDRRRRRAVLAGVAVVAVAGAVVLGMRLSGGGAEDAGGARGAGAARPVQERGTGSATPSGSGSASAPPSASPSASASASSSGTPSPSVSGGERPGAAVEDDGGAPPLTVEVRPNAWLDPCGQHYLIDREPGRVAPPPVEQDAPAWVAAHGAVSSGSQFLQVTVQGTGEETVVVDGLKVRTVQKRSPLGWNDYAMGYPGVGCGGGVPTHYFTVALDAARPAVVPEAGHDDFPFKVSESDPEVYYIDADASAYDVSWTLELSWSSGSRHGTLIVDDRGRPFRTSGNNGRPAYEFPLGGSAWQRAGSSPAQ
ncbi:transcriptional regulator [Streptomyces phaeoluteigriseus]|uniref:Transcriptional regulator n=1 Tax=Streptomyces phaeoluteigriseus TaxID=114686 RepID=A0A1V6MKQ4_9ACTN|nr:helix-turn-helix transcriptional regulator [Streptomyces phaeoluteigriseus]OQD52863.1 transcriptional regulator [Streptomyces phaeoluteigriseus]